MTVDVQDSLVEEIADSTISDGGLLGESCSSKKKQCVNQRPGGVAMISNLLYIDIENSLFSFLTITYNNTRIMMDLIYYARRMISPTGMQHACS